MSHRRMADLNRHSSECVIRCSSQPLPGIGHCPNCNRIVNNVIVGQIKPSVDTEETSSAAGGLNRDTLPVCPRNSRGKAQRRFRLVLPFLWASVIETIMLGESPQDQDGKDSKHWGLSRGPDGKFTNHSAVATKRLALDTSAYPN